MNVIRDWFARHFSDPQVVTLALFLGGGALLVILFGGYLTPVIAATVLAYLLEGSVARMERWHVPRPMGAAAVSLTLVVGVAVAAVALVPLLGRQAAQIMQEIPDVVDHFQAWVGSLPAQYPSMITQEQVDSVLSVATRDIGSLRQVVLQRSVTVGVGLIYLAIYALLVPLMVFFLLRDKAAIMAWLGRFAPRNEGLVRNVWSEVDLQLANYIRGKAVEIILVWLAAYVVFSIFDLRYAMLLSALVGLSVLVPYLGAFSMTVPVALVAYAQWGWDAQTASVIGAYVVLQILDGNVLVPVLFSEAVSLHPVAIIAAVLFFGGVWGFWGVFFAIPLATVINAVINAWPENREKMKDERENLQAPEA